jgi:hypothetical protein
MTGGYFDCQILSISSVLVVLVLVLALFCEPVVGILLFIVVLSLKVGLWWNFSVYLVGEKIDLGEKLLK